MLDKLQFDAATHTYRVAGEIWPSVTQVIDQLGLLAGIPLHVLRAAGTFGTNVHRACDLLDRGELDRGALDPALEPYVAGWERFVKDSGVVIIASESRTLHPALKYAGTYDSKAMFPRGTVPHIIDRKTSAVLPRSVGPQTAAYQAAEVMLGHQVSRLRYCVHLREDGSYRLEKLDDPADFGFFVSFLNTWRFLNANSNSNQQR